MDLRGSLWRKEWVAWWEWAKRMDWKGREKRQRKKLLDTCCTTHCHVGLVKTKQAKKTTHLDIARTENVQIFLQGQKIYFSQKYMKIDKSSVGSSGLRIIKKGG